MKRFAWRQPTTLASAAAFAATTVADAMVAVRPDTPARHGAVLQAGGIDNLDLMKEDLLQPNLVISLRAIPGLDKIEKQETGWRIGAGATLMAVAGHPEIQAQFPALAACLNQSASPQIRAVATLGGNLLQRPRCWYFRSIAFDCLRKGGGHCFAIHGENAYHAVFDNEACAIVHPSSAATVLVALGASAELTGPNGATRRPLLEDFLVRPEQNVRRENDLQPREILTAILLPNLSASVRMAYLRLGEKRAFDWPLVDAAVILELDASSVCRQGVICLGAVAPTPYRPRAAETILAGKVIDVPTARSAARTALDGAMPLAHNEFKLPLIETVLRRAILRAANPV